MTATFPTSLNKNYEYKIPDYDLDPNKFEASNDLIYIDGKGKTLDTNLNEISPPEELWNVNHLPKFPLPKEETQHNYNVSVKEWEKTRKVRYAFSQDTDHCG